MPRFDDATRALVAARVGPFPRQEASAEGLRRAAVAVALVADGEQQTAFVLTRRAARLRSHAGQWALPGGRLDPGETPEQAALRELHEEVGLSPGADAVIGRLDDYPSRSGYLITPVVVWCAGDGRLAPNPAEVAAVYLVPLSDLDRPDVPRLISIPESDRPVIQVPLAMMKSVVHAPTAAVLYQLREVVLHGRATRVAHFDQPVFAWR